MELAEITAKLRQITEDAGRSSAGAAAAVYAARKGIHTGVVAERFGGQVLGTFRHRELHLDPGRPKVEVRQTSEEHVRAYERSTS